MVGVRERQFLSPDFLVGFMAFARYQQHIFCFRMRDAVGNRVCAIELHLGLVGLLHALLLFCISAKLLPIPVSN